MSQSEAERGRGREREGVWREGGRQKDLLTFSELRFSSEEGGGRRKKKRGPPSPPDLASNYTIRDAPSPAAPAHVGGS